MVKDTRAVEETSELNSHAEIQQAAHRIAGEDCYLVKIRTSTNKELEQLLRRIRSIHGVARTRTTLVLSTEHEQPSVDVPEPVGVTEELTKRS